MTTVEHDLSRVPPQDLDAEQSALGGTLLSAQALREVRSALTAADFYRPAHAEIFTATCELADRGEPVDPITLAPELERRGSLARVGGATYLHTLVNAVPTAANAAYYAEIIRRCAVRRHAIEAHTRAITELYAGDDELAEMCDRHEADIHAAHSDARTRTTYRPLGEIIAEVIDDIDSGEEPDGVLTGFQDVDQLTHGFQPGELVVVAARPAVGKSTLALDFLRTITIQQNIPAALFSLEMGDKEIGQRVLSAESRVPLHRIRGRSVDDDDWERIKRRTNPMVDSRLFVDSSPNLTMAEIATKARELHTREGIELLAVDYLQLLESGRRRHGNRQEEVSEISRRLKLLAKELGIPVIALSQLNRGPESREDKKPMVADLRESGAVEQDADMVILIHRPDVYDKASPRSGEADLIFGKCRNAPTCEITVGFLGHLSQFTDMASMPGSENDYRSTLPRRETPQKAPVALPNPRPLPMAELALASPQVVVQGSSRGDHAEGAPAPISEELSAAVESFGSDVLALTVPVPAPCPPGCVACATDESHDPAPPADRAQAPAEPAEPVLEDGPQPKARAARRAPASKAALTSFVADKVTAALEEHDGDQAAALNALAGDGGTAIPDVMELFEATRVETTYEHTAHPKLPDPLTRKRRDEADQVWEARPKFRHPDPLDDDQDVTELDVNAAYLAALQSAHLPVRSLTHNPDGWDDLDQYGKGTDLAGIVKIEPVAWEHPNLPHPLGDDRETAGTLWVPTSTLIQLRDLATPGYGSLCEEPVIREAHVAAGSAALFKDLVRVLDAARTQAQADGDTLTKAYVASMYAKLVSTMGDSRANHQLRRPDWQHIIRGHAFANLRRKAIRAAQAGLTIVHAGGTDELHLAATPETVFTATHKGKPVFREGRALSQIKVKNTHKAGER